MAKIRPLALGWLLESWKELKDNSKLVQCGWKGAGLLAAMGDADENRRLRQLAAQKYTDLLPTMAYATEQGMEVDPEAIQEDVDLNELVDIPTSAIEREETY